MLPFTAFQPDPKKVRREAQRQWEAERPKRILGYLITGVQLVIGTILFYAFLFAGALWASM